MKRLLSGIIACALVAAVSRGQTTPTPAPSVCAGNCNGDGQVTVDELVTLISIALNGDTATCPSVTLWCDYHLGVQCVIPAVTNALNGCPNFPADGACMLALTFPCNAATAFPANEIPSRRACCQKWANYYGPGAIYWCPAESFDAATGRCTACSDPCTASPCSSQADCLEGFTCTDGRCCPTAPPGSCFPTPVIP